MVGEGWKVCAVVVGSAFGFEGGGDGWVWLNVEEFEYVGLGVIGPSWRRRSSSALFRRDGSGCVSVCGQRLKLIIRCNANDRGSHLKVAIKSKDSSAHANTTYLHF